MEKTFEVFFYDLVPATRQKLLKFLNLQTPEEGNYDVMPLTVITAEDEEGSDS